MIILKSKIVTPLVTVFKSGITAEKLALSIACGIAGGVFPIPATTTIICALLSFIFNLNLITVQVINLSLTPLQLASFLYFIQWGELILGYDHLEISLDLIQSYTIMESLSIFGTSFILGCVAWLFIMTPITILLYFILKPLLAKYVLKKKTKKI